MLPGKKLTSADLLAIAKRRLWLIVVPPVLLGFAALIYSSTLPNVYQADMLIAVDPQRVPDAFVRTTVTLQTDRRMEAITVQVLSRTNLERMIDEFDLYKEERAWMAPDDVVVKMRGAINVQLEFPRPRWGVPPEPTAFHVRFTYPDPAVAAKVTQQLGQLFVEQNVADRNALATATNQFLQDQLVESRQKLEQHEQRLKAFRQQHGAELPTQMQTNMQALQSKQMQIQALVESMARERDRKMLLERLYREAAAETAPVTTTAAAGRTADEALTSGSLRQQLSAGQANLASLERRYTPDHPDVVRARRNVADLEARIASEPAPEGTTAAADAVVDPARRESLRQMAAEIESLDRQTRFKESEERRLRAEVDEYQRRVEAVPGLESEFAALMRDYDTQQVLYKELLSKSEASRVAASLEEQNIGERFRIVDPARVPVHPLASQRIRYNGAGVILGLLLGLGIAVFLEMRDKSFRSDADILDVLNLPVLASIPYVESAAEQVARQRKALALSALGVVCAVGMGYLTWTLKLWKSLV